MQPAASNDVEKDRICLSVMESKQNVLKEALKQLHS